MIQRPQTLFLALAIIGNAIATSGISIWQKIGTSGQKAELFANKWLLFQNEKEVATHHTIAITLLVTLSTIITLVTILSFKNRMRQMMLGLVNSLVLAGAMGYAFWVIFKEAVPTFEPEIQEPFDPQGRDASAIVE
ncbi:MAG: hypothetical protein RI950_1382 [Bacteroidota bacterium]